MDAARYGKIREVLHAAGGKQGAERRAYLDEACRADPELRREVERLLETKGVATNDLVPAAAPAPSGTLGPYRLEREIGRGGMGTVYEAIDSRTSRRVALKVLHPYLLTAGSLKERFSREARLGQQVHHRNVVRTLEFATAGDYDLLVMEYVEGKTLRGLVEQWGTVPEGLLREIGRQAAEGLAAIHDAGIIHRDLKPENILLTDDRRVRIMDMGVAKVRDASVSLTREGQFLGSLPYAAPEQCDGREIGPAADLYALGVVLYELATGDNPFRADTPGASLRAQLDLVPPPATERNPDVSTFLTEVIATLLAKDPGARFPSAAALAEALEAGEPGAWWAAREREIRARRLPRVPVRRETPLLGRDAEMRSLAEAWQRAARGAGGVVLIEGEPGIGKTRLVDAFFAGLDPERTHVLYGAFPPGSGLRGIVDAVLARFGREGVEAEIGARLGDLSALAPAIADLLRDGGAPAEPESLEAAFRQLLRALARERPVAWAIDDLHFAPERARGIAYAMARAAEGERALLLLSVRALPAGEVAALERLPHFRRLTVARLSPGDAAALARRALGREEGAADVARRSDGVPFFACELAKVVREGTKGELPSAVRGLLSARLAALSREDRALLDAGAVQGHEFDGDLVAAALGLPVVTVLQQLAGVERGSGLVRAAGRRYRFDHQLVQEVLYDELPPRLREEYHARLADAYPVREGPAAARFLASHHLRGSRPEAARPFLGAALDHLARRYLHEEALALLEHALQLELPPAERIELLVRQAGIHELLGRREPQRAAAEEALALAQELGDPRHEAAARIACGTLAMNVSRDDEGLAHHTRALELAEAAGDERLVMVATGRVGGVYARMRRDLEAMEALARFRDMARRLRDPFEEVRALTLMGISLRHLSRHEEARDVFAEALALCDREGLRRARCYAEGNLGTSLWLLGDFAGGRAHLERNLALASEIGDRRSESAATGNLGLVLRDMGELDAALRCFRRHIGVARDIGDRRAQVVAHMNLGELLEALGADEEAEAEIAQSEAVARELAHDYFIGRVCVTRGRLVRARGDAAGARRTFTEALTRARACGDRVGEAWALAELGEEEPARLDEAWALARELDQPTLDVIVAAKRGDVAAAEEILAREGKRMSRLARLEAHHRLWKASGDARHVAAAAAVLAELRADAPAEYRDTLVERVPAHREIVASHPETPG